MGFSRVKEVFSRRAIRCVILLDSGQVLMKTLRYDRNNFIVHKDKCWVYDPQAAYYAKNKTYSFYYENDPCPIIFPGSSAPKIRASDIQALIDSKVIQETIQGGNMNLILLLLVVVNILVSIVIIAKLWGAFDK